MLVENVRDDLIEGDSIAEQGLQVAARHRVERTIEVVAEQVRGKRDVLPHGGPGTLRIPCRKSIDDHVVERRTRPHDGGVPHAANLQLDHVGRDGGEHGLEHRVPRGFGDHRVEGEIAAGPIDHIVRAIERVGEFAQGRDVLRCCAGRGPLGSLPFEHRSGLDEVTRGRGARAGEGVDTVHEAASSQVAREGASTVLDVDEPPGAQALQDFPNDGSGESRFGGELAFGGQLGTRRILTVEDAFGETVGERLTGERLCGRCHGAPPGNRMLAVGHRSDQFTGAPRSTLGWRDVRPSSPRPRIRQNHDVPLPTAADLRARIPDMNDGIIATAGVIEGFLAAGAGTDALLAASIAATVAGAGSLGGVKFSEAAAERDAEGVLIEEERRALARSPEAELEELAAYYVEQGVEPELAAEVARQVSARDALGAQLETEHGIRERTPASAPVVAAAGGALAFVLGGALPIGIVLLTPPDLRAPATIAAVLISLAITAVVTARLGRASVGRTVLRALLIGALTLLLSVIAGQFLPDPDGATLGAPALVGAPHDVPSGRTLP